MLKCSHKDFFGKLLHFCVIGHDWPQLFYLWLIAFLEEAKRHSLQKGLLTFSFDLYIFQLFRHFAYKEVYFVPPLSKAKRKMKYIPFGRKIQVDTAYQTFVRKWYISDSPVPRIWYRPILQYLQSSLNKYEFDCLDWRISEGRVRTLLN